MVSTFNPEIVGFCANVSNKREDIFFSFINESMTAMMCFKPVRQESRGTLGEK